MTMNATIPTSTKAKSNTYEKNTAKIRNGVDTEALFATINAVGGQRELAQFVWRASNRWVKGTHSRTQIEAFSGAGGDHEHIKSYSYDGDHPQVMTGADQGATPVEYVLVALASCLTAGIGNIAAARGIDLTEVESTLEGAMDVSGLLGLDDDVRNGYQRIKVRFAVKGNAPKAQLEKIVAQSRARSAVFDIITNGVPVEIEVDATETA